MMHCKRLLAFVIYCYCCLQLLFLQLIWCASINGDTIYSTPASNCSPPFMQCANLVNITYPFWGSASCAASPSYVLSNCTSSSTQAYWDSFSDAALGVIGSPAVTAVAIAAPGAFDPYSSGVTIQLSWNRSLIDLGYCAPPFSSTNLSLYNIPSSINLTHFPDNSALNFSAQNTFLLFNCARNVTQLGSENFLAESDECTSFKGMCAPLGLAKTPCVEWSVSSSKELMLQHVLDRLACSHFMFGIASYNTWFTGSIEVLWTDIQCEKCETAYGNCIFDPLIPAKFNHCMCSYESCFPLSDECRSLQCNTGAKIGIGVAAVIAVLGILMMIRFRRHCGERTRVGFLSFIKVSVPIAINVLKRTLRKLQSISYGPNTSLDSIDFDGLTERPIEYSYSALASATKSFSSLVGEGGFGSVYKGTLTQTSSDAGSQLQQIAVKVLEVKSKHRKKQFLNEVVTIGRIHHVNVVRLRGFCMQEDHEMLVYEYVVNGSLDRWLFAGQERAQEQVLDWGQRYAIALGVARGLSYLHEECRHRTVHCDIKPQNILLDEHMHPKIADFGLAKLMGREESKVVTFAKGTPGYMAPEFWMGGESQLSTKFDVYSYGMVLLELISGRRNFWRDVAVSGSFSFPAMAFKAAMEGDLESILDSRLSSNTSDGDEAQKQGQWHQIKTAVFVALWCIQDNPARRPCMSEVVMYLEGGAVVLLNRTSQSSLPHPPKCRNLPVPMTRIMIGPLLA